MAHKNLSYESREPAFLQRLRAQAAGVHHERPLNRPKKQRNPEDDEEDEPVYVLEDNSTLSGKEFEALKDETEAKAKAGEADDAPTSDATSIKPSDGDQKGKEKTKDAVLEVGAKAQKRKIGKVIGAGTSGDEADGKGADDKRSKQEKDGKEEPRKTKKPRPKQKVKLSFGDD
ncbi:hypothetical protein Dda_2716 [Drechslerella dactyloides]|uniref:DUF4604 domain-containing protein n=1 Tax=Drechslerella dactyloides TaxID=74499 RepID=A0AAD6J0Z0_DREDA|nr:hypothetical protein Dda_2716 [Drechslerella dactyloides]